MEIRLYNSYFAKIETLKPLKANQISMYVCGPTVYDYIHIGNLRPVIVFDVLRRLLEEVGYQVTYVSNYTDVNDKISDRAQQEGSLESEIAATYIQAFEKDVSAINSLPPHQTPKVSDYIDQIINYIKKLIEKEAAYIVDGEVFFSIEKAPNYGQLANMDLQQLMVGARVEANEKKRNPLDFVLWKKSDQGERYHSPWSLGRPGWHTECAAMIECIFPSKMIDIHGGGFDLKFPHHSNEIAQSYALNNNRLANIWMHNGFIVSDDEKMSKSLGNIIKARDAIELYGGPALRLAILSTHYRLPVNLTDEVLNSSVIEYNKMRNTFRQLAIFFQRVDINLDQTVNVEIEPFLKELGDDLNVSNSLTIIFEHLKLVHRLLREKQVDIESLTNLYFSLKKMFYLLGIDVDIPNLSFEDLALMQDYEQAKANKDYMTSDKIRSRLIERELFY